MSKNRGKSKLSKTVLFEAYKHVFHCEKSLGTLFYGQPSYLQLYMETNTCFSKLCNNYCITFQFGVQVSRDLCGLTLSISLTSAVQVSETTTNWQTHYWYILISFSTECSSGNKVMTEDGQELVNQQFGLLSPGLNLSDYFLWGYINQNHQLI
jgi:hypothetical protein